LLQFEIVTPVTAASMHRTAKYFITLHQNVLHRLWQLSVPN